MRSRLADTRDLVLLTAGAVAAAYMVPLVPFVGAPLAAFALALIAYRFGDVWSWAAVFGASAVAIALNASYGALVFALVVPVLIVAGPLGARLLQKRPALAVAVIISTIVFSVMIASFGIQAALEHTSLVAFFQEQVKQGGEAARAMAGTKNSSSGLNLTDAQMLLVSLSVMPGLLVVACGATGILSTVAMTSAGRRAGVPVNALPRLTTLEISTYALVPFIAGILLLAGGLVAKGTWSAGLTIAGGNLLTVAIPLLTLQGVGIALFLLQRFEVPRWGRILAITAALLIEWLLPLLTLAGLVDTWLNLRRLPRDGEGSPEPR